MPSDPFDDLLELESDFYKEGFEAGIADSTYAGLVEGKVFGIEKGYEKALEIGKAYGRALVWKRRLDDEENNATETASSGGVKEGTVPPVSEVDLFGTMKDLPPLPTNPRLKKHIAILLSLTDSASIPKDNSDESVSEVDERITKIRARMKMVSNLVGEAVDPASTSAGSIEDSGGLQARQ